MTSIRGLLLAALLLLAPIGLAACAADGGHPTMGCATAATPCLSGNALVALETSKGRVVLELDGKAAPLTAGNFVDLVRRGVYNGTVFHRVVRDPVPFVVQGGDPTSADSKVPASRHGTGNFLDPDSGEPRLIPLELKLKGADTLRYGEAISSPTVSVHRRVMARSSSPRRSTLASAASSPWKSCDLG